MLRTPAFPAWIFRSEIPRPSKDLRNGVGTPVCFNVKKKKKERRKIIFNHRISSSLVHDVYIYVNNQGKWNVRVYTFLFFSKMHRKHFKIKCGMVINLPIYFPILVQFYVCVCVHTFCVARIPQSLPPFVRIKNVDPLKKIQEAAGYVFRLCRKKKNEFRAGHDLARNTQERKVYHRPTGVIGSNRFILVMKTGVILILGN